MNVPTRHAIRLVGTYGVAHALVDASCAALVFGASAAGRLPVVEAAAAAITYNVVAFATQPLFGWFLTDVSRARTWARAGAVMVAVAFALSLVPHAVWLAVVLTGLGNAVFHLGGGVISLRIRPGGATLPGLYVAPGAAGLALGIWLGNGETLTWLPALALVLMLPFFRVPASADASPRAAGFVGSSPLLAAIVMLLAVVAIRAFVGTGIEFPWKVDTPLLVGLTAAVVLGKALGGVLADRHGLMLVGVSALVASVPLLVAGPTWPWLGMAGALLFNMTMPVTLVALFVSMPARPGFAFGLTCLVLLCGSLPFMLEFVDGLASAAVVVAAIAAAVLLAAAFRIGRIAGAAREMASQCGCP